MKKFYTLFLILLAGTMSFGQVITSWNFDSSTLTPTTGSGTFAFVGVVVENTQSSCSCGFVGGNPTTGKAYTTKTYPDQGVASGTAGVRFAVSTLTKTGINVYIDVFGSNTASKFVQLQYTVNGIAWLNAGTPTIVPYTTASQWITISQALPATADNNANFAIRVVSVFDPAGTTYSAINPANTYAATGALRYDNVIISSGTLFVNQNSISGLAIYPNPVKGGILYFDTQANAEKSVSIFDVIGKQVVNVTAATNAVNVSNLKDGVYIVKITENGKSETRKLVINN